MPNIPGVNDNYAHFKTAVKLVSGVPGLIRIDVLLYQQAAGAKYARVNRIYQPDFDENCFGWKSCSEIYAAQFQYERFRFKVFWFRTICTNCRIVVQATSHSFPTTSVILVYSDKEHIIRYPIR